ncbi:MAG: aminotransferase class IV [Flavisolibacter sp.]
MNSVCFNGDFLHSNKKLFTTGNRSFRYGDGVFETIKVYKGKIVLEQYHYDRMFVGIKFLQITNTMEASILSNLILELCRRNGCLELARVRLAVFRNDEGASDFVIEAVSLPKEVNEWHEQGLAIDLYPYARKNADAFANVKSANFLPYVLAELFAKEKGIDDALVLNAFNYVADSSKANVFLVKGKEIITPALNQGCVNGVVRRFLVEQLKTNNYRIRQDEVSEQELLEADEIFLTNSIYDMRWVRRYRDKQYSPEKSYSIYQKMISPLYE